MRLGSTSVAVKLPPGLKPVVSQLPQTQRDITKLTNLADEVVHYAPYFIIGGVALVGVFAIVSRVGRK